MQEIARNYHKIVIVLFDKDTDSAKKLGFSQLGVADGGRKSDEPP
jgi:hypothetical protein